MPRSRSSLVQKDACLTHLFLAASLHSWDLLPKLCQNCFDAGCGIAEVRGCVRHLVVVAGYTSSLAATKHLYNAQLLPEDVPGKSGGPPGNAFELVYISVTDAVRRAVRKVDPVLADWIRVHLYGDVYSSPGLDMKQKQLLMVAFLGQANMLEEMSGHALAGMRFGVSPEACRQALDLGFDWHLQRLSPAAQQAAQQVQQEAQAALQKAVERYDSKYAADGPHESQFTIPDPTSVRLPPLPPRHISPGQQSSRE
ncbi:TPA: hypothetical protein ACH3X3_004380 [Trebouxia sp. C0006]